jgi:hypothetical protein
MAHVIFGRVQDSPGAGQVNHVVHVEAPGGHPVFEVPRFDEFPPRLQQNPPKGLYAALGDGKP